MKKLKEQFNIDRKYRKDLWKTLENKWKEFELPPYSWYQTKVFRFAVVCALFVILIGSGGTSAYAYSSDEVVAGNMLYPLKQKIEVVEERMQKTPSAKAEFYLKIMERREKELVHIRKFKKNETRTVKDIDRMKTKLETAKTWVNNKDIKDPVLKNRIENKLKQRNRIMQERVLKMNQKQRIKN